MPEAVVGASDTPPTVAKLRHAVAAFSTYLVLAGGFDFNINAGRQAELVQGFNRLGGRLHNVNQPLMGANLELLSRLLVDMWSR